MKSQDDHAEMAKRLHLLESSVVTLHDMVSKKFGRVERSMRYMAGGVVRLERAILGEPSDQQDGDS